MSKELNPSLKGLALQIALQLPDDQRDAMSALQYAREIVERGREKLVRARVHPTKARRIAVNMAKRPRNRSKRAISTLA